MDSAQQSNEQIEDCNLDRNRSRDDGSVEPANVVISSDYIESPNPQSHQPSSFIAQPSTSVIISSFNSLSDQQHSIDDEEEFSEELLAEVKREIEEENEIVRNCRNWEFNEVVEDNEGANVQVNQFSMNNLNVHNVIDNGTFFDRLRNVVDLNESTYDELLPNPTPNPDTSLSNVSPSSNEQSKHNLTNSEDEEEDQVNHDTQQLGDETKNAQMVHIEKAERKGTEDNEGGDEVSLTVENVRIETILPHHNEQTLGNARQSARHSKRKQTDKVDNEENAEEVEEDDDDNDEVTSQSVKRSRLSHSSRSIKQKQIITIALQCPRCDLMFAKEKLNAHLKEEHSVDPFRCLLKYCCQAFDSSADLRGHLAQSHQSTTRWYCDKCSKYCKTNRQLSEHYNYHHQLGHFQCAFSVCPFTAKCKKEVYSHYSKQHKPIFACQHPGCPFKISNEAKLKKHQHTHLGIRPYRCKWFECYFASTRRFNTIRHIQRNHLTENSEHQNYELQLVDPNDFVEVIDELL